MAGCSKPGEKIINTQELASSIQIVIYFILSEHYLKSKILFKLLEDLEYQPSIGAKALLQPSQQLFYQVFEVKFLNIKIY